MSHGYAMLRDKVDQYDGRELSLKMRHDEIGGDYELQMGFRYCFRIGLL
jgi:hypothetical protein